MACASPFPHRQQRSSLPASSLSSPPSSPKEPPSLSHGAPPPALRPEPAATRWPARGGSGRARHGQRLACGRSSRIPAGADACGAPRHVGHQPRGQPGVASGWRPSHPDAAPAGEGSREGKGRQLLVVEAEKRAAGHGWGGRR
ncbi:hypothetical protein C2845_PM02G46020 [Panicum miliaceum]|uniref:Uncharacterized protein n=1 Tax=Panicum miliaceum TaxID=4540 RepID=A0A3L6S415_PANMI|nr:hypothetical protein C2845_PM02G46020 [Panicum miliaceum]